MVVFKEELGFLKLVIEFVIFLLEILVFLYEGSILLCFEE